MAKRQRYPQLIKKDSLSLKHRIIPKTYGQEHYLNTLRESTVTICTGPAGCGKTWLVTAVALEKLFNNEVSRIVITKPIVESGEESLGFLPGVLEEKLFPYIQAIMENIEDHVGVTAAKKLIEDGKIVFAPIAYLRGRDFKDAFIIVDEAQNLTKKGIKLMMSRLGEGSVMAINGDSDQVDINERDSGLMWSIERLRGKNKEINVVEMVNADICRHPLIQCIVSNLVI